MFHKIYNKNQAHVCTVSKHLRNSVNRTIKRAKYIYYEEIINPNKNNSNNYDRLLDVGLLKTSETKQTKVLQSIMNSQGSVL